MYVCMYVHSFATYLTVCTIFYKKHVYKKHEAEIRQKLRNI